MKISIILILSILTSFTSVAVNAAGIAPSNGTWQPEITSHQAKGCPSMMQAALSQAKMDTSTKTINFSQPFHPNDLFDPKDINPENNPNVKWVNSQPNFWEVTILNNQEGMELSLTWQLTLTSKTSMEVTSNLSMKFSKEIASMMGSTECKVDSSGHIKRIAE